MPDLAKIEAVAAKLSTEGAEPASEENAAAPPDGVSSGAGSAPADEGASASVDGAASPGAPTIDSAAIERKLAADRERREERARKKQQAEDAAAAKREREAAEAERKADAEAREKYKSMSWKERALAEGRDPREVWEEMRQEALAAGTPEARIEAVEKLWGSKLEDSNRRIEALEKRLDDQQKAHTEERAREQQAVKDQRFVHAFERTLAKPEYEALTDEYQPEQLFGFAVSFRDHPEQLFERAKALGVRLEWEEQAAARLAAGEDLTDEEPTFTMSDILNVLRTTQERHYARLEEQRRKKTAAPPTGPGAPPRQAPVAKQPTVNGTAERNAGTSLGNHLASSRAADPPSLKGMSREEKVRKLAEKYPG